MTTVLRQPLKAVLGMLALLLAACGESHEQMVLQPALGKQLEVPVGATLIIEEGSIN